MKKQISAKTKYEIINNCNEGYFSLVVDFNRVNKNKPVIFRYKKDTENILEIFKEKCKNMSSSISCGFTNLERATKVLLYMDNFNTDTNTPILWHGMEFKPFSEFYAGDNIIN